jgi:hypothetical protein
MLSVIMLRVIMLSVIMLSVIVVSVIMLSVIMLSVIALFQARLIFASKTGTFLFVQQSKFSLLGKYSQHFIFCVTYERVQ